MPKCSSCGADIIWAKMAKTGKANPLDAKPEKRVILVDFTGAILTGGAFARVVDTYVSHFATCPDAPQHRRKDR